MINITERAFSTYLQTRVTFPDHPYSTRYAFIEFADEEEAEKAKAELAAKNFNVFVDYVGEKSTKGSSSAKESLTLMAYSLHHNLCLSLDYAFNSNGSLFPGEILFSHSF